MTDQEINQDQEQEKDQDQEQKQEEEKEPEQQPEKTSSETSAATAEDSTSDPLPVNAPATTEETEEENKQEGEPVQQPAPVDGTPAPAVEQTSTPCLIEEPKKPDFLKDKIMSHTFNLIEDRLGQRVSVARNYEHLGKPFLNDADSAQEFQKSYKEYSKQYRHACWNMNQDMKALILALKTIQAEHPYIDVGKYIDGCYGKVPQEAKPVPTEEKREKAPEKIPGQLDIPFPAKDDKSTAEPASECVTISGAEAADKIQQMDSIKEKYSWIAPESYQGAFLAVAQEIEDAETTALMLMILDQQFTKQLSDEQFKTLIMSGDPNETFYGKGNLGRVLEVISKEEEVKPAKKAKPAAKKAVSSEKAQKKAPAKAPAKKGKAKK